MTRATRAPDIPDWAETLVDLVMTHEGMPRPPHVAWTCGPLPDGHQAMNSTGVTCGDWIAIDQGASERDARHTLLHELAHWVTDSGHTMAMYAKLYELLWLFGEPGDLEYARSREGEYQPDPAAQGWDRFSARAETWIQRAEGFVERVLSHPVRRVVFSAVGVMLGVDSLQQLE